jgi:pimeloyl-ACP methyl ester carboxylesterase
LSLADTGEKRWLPPGVNLCNLYDLALQEGNAPICGAFTPKDIKADDVIRTELLGVIDIYGTFLNRLVGVGGYNEYEFDNNPVNRTFAGCQQRHASYPTDLPTPTLFVFAYDWRKSNFENVNALKQYVQCARLFHPGKEVNIVAHSMGGLLSRNYILQNPGNHHVDKLITIGSPFLGTPKGLNVLQTGNFLDSYADYITSGILKNLIEFYPGAHELLSSQTYFNGVYPQTPVSIKYPWTPETPMSYFSTRTWIDDQHPVSRPATRAELFHNYLSPQRQSQDAWQNDQTDVQYFHIYGVQNNETTIGKLIITERTICLPLQTQCNSFTRYTPVPTVGDNTVTLESAKRIFSGGKDYNYKPQDNSEPFRFFEQPPTDGDEDLADHNKMLSKGPRVSNRVIKILQPEYPFTENQMSAPDCGNTTEVKDCNALNPIKEKLGSIGQNSNYISLNNTGNFSITAQSSQIIGFSSEDGVDKTPTGENSAWVAMPDNGITRTITFRTIAVPMEIEIVRGVDYDNVEKLTVFKDLALPADKKVELVVFAGGSISLFYYADGDDQSPTRIPSTLIVQGEMAKDINSPVLSYNYQNGSQGKTVSLSATDDLSGVRQIRYSLDGQNFSAYTTPLSVSSSQERIYAFAEDNNRNRTGIAEFDLSGNSYSIGNRVWFDTNDDGKINLDEGFGEGGISGVSLSLFTDNNSDGQPDQANNPIASTVSDAQGYYRFDNLSSGNYLVSVNPTNFADGGILQGYRNTTGNSSSNTDSDDTNNGENGIEPIGAANSVQTTGILSNTISIIGGVNQPTDETDLAFGDNEKIDGLSNSTVDFGFYQLGISGTVWNDSGNGVSSNNGILDSGETGVGNIRVRLFYSNSDEVPVGEDGILGTSDDAIGTGSNANSGGMFTNASGNYTFKGLASNNYLIKVFRAGSSSSAIFSNNPNNNIDSDNNGTTGTGTDSTFIISSNFAATANDYGLQGNTFVDNDSAATQNPTIDFGLFFAPTAASVSVGGRVLSADGQSINRVVVTLTNSNGNLRQTVTNSFGYYNFAEVVVGETYIISVRHLKYNFSPNSQIISLTDFAENINFTALP